MGLEIPSHYKPGIPTCWFTVAEWTILRLSTTRFVKELQHRRGIMHGTIPTPQCKNLLLTLEKEGVHYNRPLQLGHCDSWQDNTFKKKYDHQPEVFGCDFWTAGNQKPSGSQPKWFIYTFPFAQAVMTKLQRITAMDKSSSNVRNVMKVTKSPQVIVL